MTLNPQHIHIFNPHAGILVHSGDEYAHKSNQNAVCCCLWRHLLWSTVHAAGRFVYIQTHGGKVCYFQPSDLRSAVVTEVSTSRPELASASSRHALNLQVAALLMWAQRVETDGAEWKKVTFSASYVALLMRSLKNPRNTPSVRSVGINNSAGDEFCQKAEGDFYFFYFFRHWAWKLLEFRSEDEAPAQPANDQVSKWST